MNKINVVQFFAVLAIIVGLGVSYFPPPTNGAAIWALVSGFLGYGVRDLFAEQADQKSAGGTNQATPADKQAGFVRLPILTMLIILAAIGLAGCGVLNTFTGAQLNSAEANYAGSKQNVKAADDMKLIAWADAACAMPVGALQRNATGNPYAVNAVLTACPIPNVGVIKAQDGNVSVQFTTPTPTQPYAPAKDGVK